ncbi:MAG: hypothetical protein JNL61_01070 [Rhizobiaceae bacterium]|nr:hypothetical protein [Rhizobiaceae bacterium]
MDHLFADGVKDMQVANGTVRFTLVQRGAGERELIDVGRIIIPVNRARDIITALQRGLDDVADQIRKSRQEGKADDSAVASH